MPRLPPNLQHENECIMLSRVDIMLHLFPNIAATEWSQRQLVRIHNRGPDMTYVKGVGLGPDKASERLHATIADLMPVIDVRQGRDEAAYMSIYRKTQDKVHSPNDWGPGVRHAGERLSFEEIHGHASLGHQVVLTLMAIKALRQLHDIKNLSIGLHGRNKSGKAIPQEIIDLMYEHLGSNEFLGNFFGFDFKRTTSDALWRENRIRAMRRVVTKCVFETGRVNKHMWLQMLDTDKAAAPGEFGQFSLEEGWDVVKMAEVVAVRQHQLWMETPGSFGILRKAMAHAARRASVEGYCWPIQRRRQIEYLALDYVEGIPVPHRYHQ